MDQSTIGTLTLRIERWIESVTANPPTVAVALDHIGWKAIDEKRVSAGMKKIAEDRPDQFSTYWNRQPEHVEIAGAMGLGEWDEKKIDVRRFRLLGRSGPRRLRAVRM